MVSNCIAMKISTHLSFSEGGKNSITIYPKNGKKGDYVYWSVVGGLVSSDDFKNNKISGKQRLGKDSSATIKFIHKLDNLKEGEEEYKILLYSDKSRNKIIGKTETIFIRDPYVSPYKNLYDPINLEFEYSNDGVPLFPYAEYMGPEKPTYKKPKFKHVKNMMQGPTNPKKRYSAVQEQGSRKINSNWYLESQKIKKLGHHIPKDENSSNQKILIGSGIAQDWENDVYEFYDFLFSGYGRFDNHLHLIFDSKATNIARNNDIIKLLDKELDFFVDASNGQRVEPDISFVSKFSTGCNSGFAEGGNFNGWENRWTSCIQDISNRHRGDTNLYRTPQQRYENLLGFAHEYHHVYQGSKRYGIETDQWYMREGRNHPEDPLDQYAWWAEGTADIAAHWIMKDVFNTLSISKRNGLNYKDIVTGLESGDLNSSWNWSIYSGSGSLDEQYSLAKYALQGIESPFYKSFNCNSIDRSIEGRVSSGGAVNECFDLNNIMAAYLMWITTPQVAMVEITKDMYELGFANSFVKHVGMTPDQFYDDFNKFMRSGNPLERPPENFFSGPENFFDVVDFGFI